MKYRGKTQLSLKSIHLLLVGKKNSFNWQACRQLKISKLVRQYVRKGSKHILYEEGEGKTHPLKTFVNSGTLIDPKSKENRNYAILRYEKYIPMYYFPYLKVL